MVSPSGLLQEHNIPYDVLWLDIEHTNGKKYFTWDKQKFPEPVAMQTSLASRGHKMVTIVDPHIASSNGYHVHDAAKRQGLYVVFEREARECLFSHSLLLEHQRTPTQVRQEERRKRFRWMVLAR